MEAVLRQYLRMSFARSDASPFVDRQTRRSIHGIPSSDHKRNTGISAIRDQAPAREVSFSLPASGKTGWVQTIIQPVPPHLMEPDEAGSRWIISMRDTTLERTLNQKYRGELDQKESVIRDLIEARKSLEDYSLRLEKRVEERTSELSNANRLQKTILDSLGQGILVFDKDGVCLPIFSKVVVKMLGEPTGRRVEELLGYSGTTAEGFNQWREAVFDQLLDFEDMVPLAPNHMKNADGPGTSFRLLSDVGPRTTVCRESSSSRPIKLEK